MSEQNSTPSNFIRHIIDNDLAVGKHSTVVTRFPPEPNGFLHIGHAKSICLNFGLAEDYAGAQCHLRFDDTNPEKEENFYTKAIEQDVRWLGFQWAGDIKHASDYYEQFYQAAVRLIKADKAYVCSLSADQMQAMRGTLTEPGQACSDRSRSMNESLDLFARMRAGEFSEGQYTLRAKIDMSAGNVNLRDPVIYRIRRQTHHRTGDAWCIYPMYDFAHALSDAIEGITHSLCTLEFQDHRPLYDWVVEHCQMPHRPQQIEFSRLNLNYTITSKRKLKQLVDGHYVDGWDDPRMATLSGMRRRGFPAQAIRKFCTQLGVSKQDSIIDMSILENCVRDHLNQDAQRRMAVLNPLKVIITNYPETQVEMLSVSNHPQNPDVGRRELPFSRELYIEREDFKLEPEPKYFRLAPGKEVRLINAYVIHCDSVIQDDQGNISELHCHYLPETLAGKKPAHGGKVKGVIHWLSAVQAQDAEVRLYDRLFNLENPGAESDFLQALNPESLQVISKAKVETSLLGVEAGDTFQFNRLGYFCADTKHTSSKPVFNRVVALRDKWLAS